MGNLVAYCCKTETLLEKEEEEPAKPVFSWDVREELNPADYCFENLDGETRGKLPGQIKGQQFSIENCKDCVLFVLDNVASLTVDDCTNCVIFIGPNKGSVFIRDCTDVKFAVSCQQFRTRDCKRIDTYLHCNTQPIIEASVGMRFACLQINYPHLSDQVMGAGISLFNNEWSNIYDFTPVEHALNWSLLPETAKFDTFLTPDHITSVSKSDKAMFSSDNSIFPLTVGNRTDRDGFGKSALLSLFLGREGKHVDVSGVLKQVQNSECRLRRSKETSMNTDTVIRIYGESADMQNFGKFAKDGSVIGFEVEGDVDTLRKTLLQPQNILIYLSSDQTSSKEINNFFNYVDMTMST